MAFSTLKYETALPLDEVKALAEMIKNKEIPTRRAEFAKHAWVFQSFVQGMTLGEPGTPPVWTAKDSLAPVPHDLPDDVVDDADAVEVLESIHANLSPTGETLTVGAIPIPPFVLEALAAYLLRKLQEWLSK